MASELVHPDPDGPPQSDFVAGTVVGVDSCSSAIAAQTAFDHAPSLITFGVAFGWIEGLLQSVRIGEDLPGDALREAVDQHRQVAEVAVGTISPTVFLAHRDGNWRV